jgi:GNAT superfamily N-acetyltransferase
VTIVAFCTGQLPDGTIIDNATYARLPVANSDQSAAIRWWADTAVVDEIYVQPAFRRTHLGTKLIYTASGFHQRHRWPDRLHSDGRRTSLGQRFVAGLRHPDRIASWTDVAADMDPPESN